MYLKGNVQVYREGQLVDEGSNLIVDGGLQYVTDLFASGTAFSARYVQLGTGSSAVTSIDTNLENPVGSRVNGVTASLIGVYRVDAFIPANNPTTQEYITEAGLFTDDNTGIMFARYILSEPQVKPVDDSLRIVWNITIGR